MPDLTMAKAKQLFEDVAGMEQNVEAIEKRMSGLRSENEQAILQGVKDIRDAVSQITGVKTSLAEATERAALKILGGEGGPLEMLKEAAKQQQDAVNKLIFASQYYANNYVIWPMAISCTVAAIIGGVIGGLMVKLLS